MLIPVAFMAVISFDRSISPNVIRTASRMLSGVDVVEKVWRDIHQVFADDQWRNLVAQDVAQQLEKGKDQQQHDERASIIADRRKVAQ